VLFVVNILSSAWELTSATDELLHTPVFLAVKPRDRFLILIQFLHFADNSLCNISDPDLLLVVMWQIVL